MNINEKVKEMSSISELKEIAKELTREEFIREVMNVNNYCPESVSLERIKNCNLSSCKDCWKNAIKDIKFKGEDMENKIDYDREYNIHEVMEFPKGTIFIDSNVKYKIINGELCFKAECGWLRSCNNLQRILEMKFKLFKKDKKVSVLEAMTAFNKGKTIKVNFKDVTNGKNETLEFIPAFADDSWCIEEGQTITPYLITDGKWYIKED